MATTKKTAKSKIDTAPIERLGKDLADAGRSVWLAGLGAFAQAEDQGKEIFDNLVEKGRAFEARYRKTVNEKAEETGRQASKVREWVGNTAKKTFDGAADTFTDALHRFGVPTREDIRTLSQRVEELTLKVETLSAR